MTFSCDTAQGHRVTNSTAFVTWVFTRFECHRGTLLFSRKVKDNYDKTPVFQTRD